MAADEHTVTTREELLALFGLTEDEMRQGAEELEAYLRAWHLKRLRKARGLSLRRIADEMHVPHERVREIERGQTGEVGLDVLRSYIRALGGDMQVTASVDGHTYRVA